MIGRHWGRRRHNRPPRLIVARWKRRPEAKGLPISDARHDNHAVTPSQLQGTTAGRLTGIPLASAEALGPDTFIEDLDAEDLQERVAFTGEFNLRINRHLSD